MNNKYEFNAITAITPYLSDTSFIFVASFEKEKTPKDKNCKL